jgi:hypothetical protein
VIDYLYLPLPKRTYKAFGDHEASGLWADAAKSVTEQIELAEPAESGVIIIDLHEE